MGGQNDKILLKVFKSFRIIPKKKKKKNLNFFENFWGALVLLMIRHYLFLTHLTQTLIGKV